MAKGWSVGNSLFVATRVASRVGYLVLYSVFISSGGYSCPLPSPTRKKQKQNTVTTDFYFAQHQILYYSPLLSQAKRKANQGWLSPVKSYWQSNDMMGITTSFSILTL